jgi:hypothetical protein
MAHNMKIMTVHIFKQKMLAIAVLCIIQLQDNYLSIPTVLCSGKSLFNLLFYLLEGCPRDNITLQFEEISS